MDNLKPPGPGTPPKPNISPTRLAPKTPIDRGRRPPRLTIPSPNAPSMPTASSPYPGSIMSAKTSNPNGSPYLYSRKESEFVTGLKGFAKSGLSIGEKSTYWIYSKLSALSKRWFTHCFLSICLAIYTVGGAVIFAAVEGRGELDTLSDLRAIRYDLIRELRNLSMILPTEATYAEYEGQAAAKITEYEFIVIEYRKLKPLIMENPKRKDKKLLWSFINSVIYCGTIYTTIGYGHMYPTTKTGQALTIVYSIIGIPLFLIALTDFGKFFTRAIKFLWSYVRRLYYTGSCRSVRKTAHMEDILQGAQIMYEIATLRRPSMFVAADAIEDPENPKTPDGTLNSQAIGSDTPTTPAPSNFEIDDEFNLPISVAIFILIVYIFLGAVMYWSLEEDWDFFAAFYFVFISMSTIGFGDYVPKHPVCMIASIVYLVFGLALMSMCINVVQVKLSDTFKDASTKLGATIGLDVEEEDGSITTVTPPPIEVPSIHGEDNGNQDKDKDKDKDKPNGKDSKNGKKEKKSSMKVKKEEDKEGDDDKPKTPKEVKF